MRISLLEGEVSLTNDGKSHDDGVKNSLAQSVGRHVINVPLHIKF